MIRIVIALIVALALLYVITGPVIGMIEEAGQSASEGCGSIAQLLADMFHITLC